MIKIIEERGSKIHKTAEMDTDAMFSKQGSKKSTDATTNCRQGGKTSSNEIKYKCNYCKKKGHKATECFKKKRDDQNANTASDVFHASETSNLSASRTPDHTTGRIWCLDSGCTSHLCKDPKLFVTCKAERNIKLASQETTRATAKGNLSLTISNGKQNKEITLADALYIPDLRTNLMSIAKIVDKNHTVLFT